ncbi:MAG: cell division protein SepF [Actinomycetota bacterium]
MSRRVSADDYEEQDSWISRMRDKLFREGEEDDYEEVPAVQQVTTTTPGPRNRARNNPGGTVLQVHANRGSQITKRVPTSLADAQRAAEDLKERRPVIVNLEKADDDLARRVIDFISGVTYALNGFYERVGDKVFLFTPANIVIADEDEVEPGGKGLFAEDDR